MNLVLCILALSLATEASVQLVTQSEILSFVSDWANSGDSFLHRLFRCGYCLSVWASLLWCLIFWLLFSYSLTLALFLILPVHRLSNWFHHIFELLNQSALWLKEHNERQGTDL